MKIEKILLSLFLVSSFQVKAFDITDLYNLIKEDKLKEIQELPKDFDLSQKTSLGRNPLMIAAALGKLDIVKYLVSVNDLAFGVNDQDLNGTTAYMFATRFGSKEIRDFLELECNANTDLKDKNGLDGNDYALEDVNIELEVDINNTRDDNKMLDMVAFLEQFNDPKDSSLLSESVVDDQFEQLSVVVDDSKKDEKSKQEGSICTLI